MPHETSDSVPESKYPPLQKPEFKPTIPPFLTENASEQDKFFVEQLSILSQYVKWSVDTQLLVHEQVRKTNGRLLKVEKEIGLHQVDVDNLKEQAAAVSPFFKPMSYFAALWDYRLFRWFFYAGTAFFVMIVYPYYLQHPFTQWLDSLAKFWIGAP